MFYSVQLLVRRGAKFYLVWKMAMATAGRRKAKESVKGNVTLSKINKTDILAENVESLCKEIVEMVPQRTGRSVSLTEVDKKFSLYVLAQLLFGTTVLYEKQVDILQRDVESLVESIKVNNFLSKIVLEKEQKKKRRRTQTRHILPEDSESEEERIAVIPSLDDQHMFDFSMAPPASITLQDDTPFLWNPTRMFPECDDLTAPTLEQIQDFEQQVGATFADFFASEQSDRGTVRNAHSFAPEDRVFNFDEIRAPGEEFDRPLIDVPIPAYMKNADDLIQEQNIPQTPVLEAERVRAGSANRPITPLDKTGETLLRSAGQNDSALHTPGRSAKKQKVDEFTTLALPESVPDLPHQAVRRKRRRELHQLSMDDMKHHRENYTSLLHAPEDLRVKFCRGRCEVKDVFDPSPYLTYEKRFAVNLRELYKTNVNFDWNKGTRVRQEDEESQSSDNDFRSRRADFEEELEELNLFDPHFGKSVLRESPARPTGDDLDQTRREFDDRMEYPVPFNEQPQPLETFDNNGFQIESTIENVRASDARASIVPQRQDYNGSLQEAYTIEKESEPFAKSYSRSGPLDFRLEKSKDRILELARYPEWTDFEQVVPKDECNRRLAARAFYSLLELKKSHGLEMNQKEPFGRILYRMPQESSEEHTLGNESPESGEEN